MKATIATRELFVLDDVSGTCIGTYHNAREKEPRPASTSQERGRVGVLFLNSLTPTRSATGDSAVYWADAFAQRGYPSMRVDMAGFGDSSGNPPTDPLGFMNNGSYAAVASTKVPQIVERFRLSGVILIGLCAGAVSAIYTAAACKQCKGVVLMDPYFHLPLGSQVSLWRKAVRRLSRTTAGRSVSNAFDRLMTLRARLPGSPPPANANLSLLRCWKTVASAGVPILLLKAPHTKLKIGDFDYLSYILELGGPKSQVVVKVVEDTGHSFANRSGLMTVGQEIENWLSIYFPLKDMINSAHLKRTDNTPGSPAFAGLRT